MHYHSLHPHCYTIYFKGMLFQLAKKLATCPVGAGAHPPAHKLLCGDWQHDAPVSAMQSRACERKGTYQAHAMHVAANCVLHMTLPQ